MDKSFSLTRRQLTRMAAASAVAGVGLARAQDSRVILGQSAAFSGPSAQLGTQFHAGAKLWFDQQNAKGGVAGRNVEIRNLDDGYEPDRCVANTEKLIKDDAFALFGYIGTPTSLAALPLLSAGGAERALAAGPARIVSLGGALTEVVYLLGAQGQLVGTDTTSLFPEAALKTAKERLSGKHSDEQRVDDCKVAPERRTRPRPVACPWDFGS